MPPSLPALNSGRNNKSANRTGLATDIQGGPKSRPPRLTVYIFKKSEPICVIFGTLQRCFVRKTSVNSILNKFIKPLAPPNDNHGNWLRHFEEISRSCKLSNVVAYFFGPPCILSGLHTVHVYSDVNSFTLSCLIYVLRMP